MTKNNVAVLFSGGSDSLAIYAMAALGRHKTIVKPESIHLLCMLNGMSRFAHFPDQRFQTAHKLLQAQTPSNQSLAGTYFVELDMGRLFQGLWLDRYEELMPRYNNKNLVCVACKLAMHSRAIIYCVANNITELMTGYTKKQNYYPEQTPTFMDKIRVLSDQFNIKTVFPVYDDFDDEMITRHVLEDLGLPSTGGGERKCLFAQTYTTATEKEIAQYLDDMIPIVITYIEKMIKGEVKAAAQCFPPGRVKAKLKPLN